PKNPFPNSGKHAKGERPLTPYEKRQVVVALKQAVKPIYQKRESLSGYELTLCLIAVAIQTGINTSPLLYMTTDALTDHPLKDNRKLLTVFKKRGNAKQLHNLRKSENVEVVQGVKLDVAYLIDTIIHLSSSLRQVSNNDLVFLYVARNSKGTITSLSDLSLHNNIKKFIK
ncbi:hypothetical protein EAY39_23675, partial [Vibrio anguillarum]|nr:hypothetical protein [Vibrio anguillarum]